MISARTTERIARLDRAAVPPDGLLDATDLELFSLRYDERDAALFCDLLLDLAEVRRRLSGGKARLQLVDGGLAR